MALEGRALHKSFGDQRAVDGVDVTVDVGESVALLGPNGAGKTTTLLMLLGAITPDRGSVRLLGHELPRGRSAAMHHVGFSAGYLPLPYKLRVREVLELFASLYGIRDTRAAVRQGLARFGISHLSNAMGTDLSSGQRTLVGMVKAVLHRPTLLVLDEPTASLDPDVALRVRDGLTDINREDGTALLITSHNMIEIEQLCERVVFLSNGRVIANDTAAAIAGQFGHDDLEQVFVRLARDKSATTTLKGGDAA